MQASRELDALIAEKVMRWRWVLTMGRDKRRKEHPDKDVWLMPPDEVAKFIPSAIRESAPVEPQNPWRRDLPYFSTEIDAAWKVVEKLHLTVTPMGKEWAAAYCNWSQSGETTAVGMTNNRQWSTAATAPLAICLAALEAQC